MVIIDLSSAAKNNAITTKIRKNVCNFKSKNNSLISIANNDKTE